MSPEPNPDPLPAGLDADTRARLRYALSHVFGGNPARIEEWLHAPATVFEGQTPFHLIGMGESIRVMRALASAESGTFD